MIELADTTWTQTNWLSCTDCLDPEAVVYNNTRYQVTVVDTNGCVVSDETLLRVRKDRNVFIPNAFSPNDDGANDVFMIFSDQSVKQINSFLIFDRWGERVFADTDFQPNDPRHGWDGRFRNEPLNPAVFVYYAEIEFVDGVTILYKGDVTLLR